MVTFRTQNALTILCTASGKRYVTFENIPSQTRMSIECANQAALEALFPTCNVFTGVPGFPNNNQGANIPASETITKVLCIAMTSDYDAWAASTTPGLYIELTGADSQPRVMFAPQGSELAIVQQFLVM